MLDYPRINTDEQGVYCEYESGLISSLEWPEIESVTAHKIDVHVGVLTVIALEHESGHTIELFSNWSGFELARDLLESQFADGEVDWSTQLNELQTHQPILTLWKRI